MEAFKCVCGKTYNIKSAMLKCKICGGKALLPETKAFPKSKEVVDTPEPTRKEIIAELKDQGVITTAKEVSSKSVDDLKSMLE